jgi:hypothetical protein
MDWYHSETGQRLFINEHAAAWHILPSTIQPYLTDPTLMATRAFCAIRTFETPIVPGAFAAIGVIAWNYVTDFIPLEIPSVLAPDGDMDWICRWIGVAPQGTPAGTFLNPNIFDNTHLSKARRRLGNDRSLLIVYQTVDVGADFGLDLRTLIKE